MGVLWAAREPLTVRAVHESLSESRELAYTTVMTVLDRLAKKGRVLREPQGRAWLYRPAESRSELIVGELRVLLGDAGDEANLVLARFVEGLPADQRRHVERVLRALPS